MEKKKYITVDGFIKTLTGRRVSWRNFLNHIGARMRRNKAVTGTCGHCQAKGKVTYHVGLYLCANDLRKQKGLEKAFRLSRKQKRNS